MNELIPEVLSKMESDYPVDDAPTPRRFTWRHLGAALAGTFLLGAGAYAISAYNGTNAETQTPSSPWPIEQVSDNQAMTPGSLIETTNDSGTIQPCGGTVATDSIADRLNPDPESSQDLATPVSLVDGMQP